jgi:DNA-binding transcriptional LysR family regulator
MVARTTIVPALPDFMATHPELELEVSSTDRQHARKGQHPRDDDQRSEEISARDHEEGT